VEKEIVIHILNWSRNTNICYFYFENICTISTY